MELQPMRAAEMSNEPLKCRAIVLDEPRTWITQSDYVFLRVEAMAAWTKSMAKTRRCNGDRHGFWSFVYHPNDQLS